jgi:hypothetical protein
MEKEHRRERQEKEWRTRSFIIAFFATGCNTLAMMFILYW